MHFDHDDHQHAPPASHRAFALGVLLNVAYLVVEAVFGVLVGSLALLADAGHNLSDVLGLLMAWGASYLSMVRPTKRRTYGWRSSTILAAMANALILLMAVGGIVWEAVRRLAEPRPVATTTMVAVAGVGVVINTATALLFLSGRKRDLNIRGAYLHMAADAGVSLGVVVAGVMIAMTGWMWVDPAVSIVIALVIFWGTWGLFRESTDLILQAVPKGIDARQVEAYLRQLPGVTDLHDLHIWAMSTTETAITAHLVKPDAADDDEFLSRTSRELQHRFGIGHATLQLEHGTDAANCRLASPDTV